jgi:hypothetical protein
MAPSNNTNNSNSNNISSVLPVGMIVDGVISNTTGQYSSDLSSVTTKGNVAKQQEIIDLLDDERSLSIDIMNNNQYESMNFWIEIQNNERITSDIVWIIASYSVSLVKVEKYNDLYSYLHTNPTKLVV